jgi:tetratricopeptide (TPR) repeat protein
VTTKLSRYAEGVMEAAWLAAIILVPLFFNVFSSRIFEPDKITILRSLAWLILAAWLVKLVENRGFHWEKIELKGGVVKTILRIPLMIPVIALISIYLIATIFSVSPSTSFWGSYQRLQGTYTTFSYIVVFLAIIGNLRKRVQLERILTAIIVVSLPIALYGILQHYKIDPIPWGGDTSIRIAANMGNSIFVAAYLIMAFPATLIRIVQGFSAILAGEESPGRVIANFIRATLYVFIAVLQVIAIYFSGSRGPWLGWGASLIFVGLGLAILWRKRSLVLIGVTLASAAAIFLIVLNIPNGPLQSFRSAPGMGRLGQLLDAESRTGRVRTLIWSGAAKLVAPHEALKFPDGSQDRFNFLRPLIGYGPESMYVAYNPFYPPELTQVEKRNASPDRSHNETWDSLVITGVLGLAIYLYLFGAIFYYGFKWMGLMTGARQSNLYLSLYIGGGVISGLVFVLWKGIEYLGVAFPFGMIAGILIYLLIAAVLGWYEAPLHPGERLRAVTILGLLAMIIAHFIEINFGIAIAATRIYFWVSAGLLLAAGSILPLYNEYSRATVSELIGASSLAATEGPARKDRGKTAEPAVKKRRTSSRPRAGGDLVSVWLGNALVWTVLIGLLLCTLGYDYLSNAQGYKSAMEVIWNSITLMQSRTSYGLLGLILIAWVGASAVAASENEMIHEAGDWLKAFGVILGGSMALGLFYWLWHSAGLAGLASGAASSIEGIIDQVARYEGVLTRYYLFMLMLVLGCGLFLPGEWPVRGASFTTAGVIVAGTGLIMVAAISAYTNIRIIQADIAFKLADPFTQGNQWPVAVAIYSRANELAPTEDYYYLFLGRAYLEQAKQLSDLTQRNDLMTQAERDLKRAQAINPLNTDHTANLARLYSLWASFTAEAARKQELGAISSRYFEQAVRLSPNNARLYDEWSVLLLSILDKQDEAAGKLAQSLKIDPYYDWTHALIGDTYMKKIGDASGVGNEEKAALYTKAIGSYKKALELADPTDLNARYSYIVTLANTYAQQGDLQSAISSYLNALKIYPSNPDKWRLEEGLARLYFQAGDKADAGGHAQAALASAPEAQKERLKGLIEQIGK